MPKVIILVGKKCSGKTTWAKKQNGYVIVSRDKIKKDLFGNRYVNNYQNEIALNNALNKRILELVSKTKDIIVDKCNLTDESIYNIRTQLTPDYEIEIKKFKVPRIIALWRKCKRWTLKKLYILLKESHITHGNNLSDNRIN